MSGTSRNHVATAASAVLAWAKPAHRPQCLCHSRVAEKPVIPFELCFAESANNEEGRRGELVCLFLSVSESSKSLQPATNRSHDCLHAASNLA